jgi:hypothetical protein
MTIGADGHGEIAFGALQAGLDIDYSRNMVFFTSAGFEEGDEFTGSGSAEINDDGTIEIEFAYHLGDETILKAEPVSSSTACSHVRSQAVGQQNVSPAGAEGDGRGETPGGRRDAETAVEQALMRGLATA